MMQRQWIRLGLVLLAAGGVLTVALAENTSEQDPATAPLASRPHKPSAGKPEATKEAAEPEAMEWLKQYMPEMHKQITEAAAKDPQQGEAMLHKIQPFIAKTRLYPPEVREAAIAYRRLNLAVYRMVREARNAGDARQKEKLTEGVRGLLNEQFEKDQVVREYEITRLERQLARLKEEVQQRANNRDKIIQDMLRRLLEPASRPAK